MSFQPMSPISHRVWTWTLLLLAVWCTHPTTADFKYQRNIAFSVERVSPLSASTETREVGGFNSNSQRLYLNIGEALDTTTGVFTAPLDGVYMFYYSFSSTINAATTRLELVQVPNGNILDQGISLVNQTLTPTANDVQDSASASVMVDLVRGDQIVMRLWPGLLDAARARPLIYTGYMVYRTNDHVYGF